MKLHHYTSESGFKGLALNRTMRLVQSTQSNDKKDTVHIHDLINERIEDFYINQDIKENNVIETILRIFNNLKYDRYVEGENEKTEKAFVICYTQKPDDRFLWTAYTNDEGYCLGINFEMFNEYISTSKIQEKVFKTANTYFMTGVIYDKDKQKSLIKDIIKKEYDKYSSMPEDIFSNNIPTIIHPYQIEFTDDNGKVLFRGEKRAYQIRIRQKFEFMTRSIVEQLLLISPLLKNNYWEDESETRLIFYRPVKTENLTDVCVDNKSKNFIEFEIGTDFLEEVIIGPNNPITIEEVKEKLGKAGYDISRISVSYSKGKDVLRERGR